MKPETKDADSVKRPKLPKRRLLKKPRKKSKPAYDGGERVESEHARQKRGVKFCPMCGSTSVFWASGLPHLWSVWECKDCGYRGAFIVRDGKLAEKIREDYAEKTAKR